MVYRDTGADNTQYQLLIKYDALFNVFRELKYNSHGSISGNVYHQSIDFVSPKAVALSYIQLASPNRLIVAIFDYTNFEPLNIQESKFYAGTDTLIDNNYLYAQKGVVKVIGD